MAQDEHTAHGQETTTVNGQDIITCFQPDSVSVECSGLPLATEEQRKNAAQFFIRMGCKLMMMS